MEGLVRPRMHGAAYDNEAAFLHRHAKAFVRCRFLSVARTIGIEEDTDRIGRELSRKAAFHPKLPCHPVCQSRSAMLPGARPDAASSTRQAAARPSGRTASRRQR